MQTAPLSALAVTSTVSPSGAPMSGESVAPFGDLMRSAVDSINDLQTQASAAVDGLIRGTGVDIHQAMIATQKADIAFELALSVRNKAVAAYQQVMGMQF